MQFCISHSNSITTKCTVAKNSVYAANVKLPLFPSQLQMPLDDCVALYISELKKFLDELAPELPRVVSQRDRPEDTHHKIDDNTKFVSRRWFKQGCQDSQTTSADFWHGWETVTVQEKKFENLKFRCPSQVVDFDACRTRLWASIGIISQPRHERVKTDKALPSRNVLPSSGKN